MKVLSIQVGLAKNLVVKDREFSTAITKQSISGPVFLDKLGFKGDQQGNLNVHGGEGRALYVFSRKAYGLWAEVVDSEKLKTNGLFGENLTLEDIDENSIQMGDHFTLGETIIEATMPRFPCLIMADHLGFPDAMPFMNNKGRPGVLFRVIKTGNIQVGDQLNLIKKSNIPVNMMALLQMARVENVSREKIDYLKSFKILPEITIERLEFRLLNGR